MSQNSSNTPLHTTTPAQGPQAPESFNVRKAILFGIALPAWVFASFMAAQLLIGLLIGGLQALQVDFSGVNEIVFNTMLSAVVYAFTLALVLGVPWLIRKRRTTLQSLGLQRAVDWTDFFWAPVGMTVYYMLSMFITFLAMAYLPFIDYTQTQQTGFSGISTQFEYILAFLSLVIIAPVAEEVLFRGYLLGKLRQHMKAWIAILITSLLFAIVHFQWNVGLDTFALSIILCLLRIKTGSLWAPILVHSLKNGIAFYLLFINPALIGTIGG